VHANRALDVPARLEALAVAAGMPREAVHAQVAAAIQAVVHVRRDGSGLRRVAEIAVLVRATSGLVEAVPALTFAASGAPVVGAGADQLDRLLVSS
jgi:pilus assembly protein CpaF